MFHEGKSFSNFTGGNLCLSTIAVGFFRMLEDLFNMFSLIDCVKLNVQWVFVCCFSFSMWRADGVFNFHMNCVFYMFTLFLLK